MPGVNDDVPGPLKPHGDIVFVPVKVKVEGKQPHWPEGITVSATANPFSAHFPEAVFDENGTTKKMVARTIGVKVIYRWEINGKPYAYSYTLFPSDVRCFFTVDFIDDRGDGVFRRMTLPGHASVTLGPPPSLPQWVRMPKS